ncbi:MAG: 3'(2'),5'-bisphosphate nucleotidase CysQ [Bacteroidales bacterium]|nr:3'(2'),5'-bisphosphate nucleotidase CysQ [Bacteroidales bacterium]
MLKNLKIDALTDMVGSAGKLIMQYYQSKDIQIQTKADHSPVTNADQASNDLLIKRLSSLYPDIPIISEETIQTPYEIRKSWEYCWMIDPLDGTKEFIKRNGEFSVNLALIHKNKPIAGFIHFPVQGWTYYALKGQGAFKKSSKIDVRRLRTEYHIPRIESRTSKIRVMISRSHSGQREMEFIEKLRSKGFAIETLPHGSAMKHCLIAEGKGDIYPKFGICYEWDTAPGQLILEEAGGRVTRTDNGDSLSYNKANLENPEFIMWGAGIPTGLLHNSQDN